MWKKLNTNKMHKRFFIFVALAWPILHWLVFTLGMNIQTFTYSFFRWNPYTAKSSFSGLDNYKMLYKDLLVNQYDMTTAFRNSILWIIVNTVFLVGLAIIIAYFLSKKIPGSEFFRVVYFAPAIISIVILTMAWQFMWDPNRGVVNGMLGAIGLEEWQRVWLGEYKTALPNVMLYCIWVGLGYNVVILLGGMTQIGQEFYEAAHIDGANKLQELIHITIPGIWPTISTLLLMGVAGAFNVYLQPMLLTKGHYGTKTVPMMIIELVNKGDFGYAATVGLSMAIVGAIITWIIKRIMDQLDRKWS